MHHRSHDQGSLPNPLPPRWMQPPWILDADPPLDVEPPPPMGYYGIQSTSGRYASYCDAFLFVLDTCLSGSGDDVYIHEPLHVALHRGLVSSRLLVDTLYGTGLPVRPVHVVTVLKQVFTFYHGLSPKL